MNTCRALLILHLDLYAWRSQAECVWIGQDVYSSVGTLLSDTGLLPQSCKQAGHKRLKVVMVNIVERFQNLTPSLTFDLVGPYASLN